MSIDPIEVHDLDLEIARFIFPRLKVFKEETLSLAEKGFEMYPDDFDNIDEWIAVVDSMIEAFETYWNGVDDFNDTSKIEKIKSGMGLFARYYSSLWL